MNQNFIVFTLEDVLIKNGKTNIPAVSLLRNFVELGWKVYIQSEEGKERAQRFIARCRLKEVIGITMWQKRYYFDIAVCHDLQTGIIQSYDHPRLNTNFIIQI